MQIDPKKAAIVLILVYGGLLLWILPPLEDLRWTDEVAAQNEVAAQEVAQAEESPTPPTKPNGRRARDGSRAPAASVADKEPDATAGPTADDATQARPARKRAASTELAAGKAKPDAAQDTQRGLDGKPAIEPSAPCATLAIRMAPGEGLSEAGEAGIVRVEVVGGTRSETALATWLTALGGPALETELFGSAGVPMEAGSTVSVRVPAGLALHVIGQFGERSQSLMLKALKRDATREVPLDLGSADHDVPVAQANARTGLLEGVAVVEASAPTTVPEGGSASDDEAQGEPCAPAPVALDREVDSRVNLVQDPDVLPDRVASVTVASAFAEDPPLPEYRDETSSARLRGFLLDQEGHGLAGISVWLVIPWGTADRKPRRLRFEDRVRAEVQTADDGSFAFAEVPDGIWLVGVAPGGTARAPVSTTEISRVARAVKLKRGQVSAEVVLRVGRGLHLRGLIEDSDGDPAGFLSVSAIEEGIAGGLWTRTAADGTFDVGPLGPGVCSIRVRVSDEGEQEFGPFEAGSGDIRIRLRAAAGVEGVVLDEAGQRADACRVQVLRLYAEPPVMVSSHSLSGGRFEVTELELGVYRLVATADGQRIALSEDIDLRSNERALGIELILTDGAEISVRLRGGKSPGIVGVARGARTVAVASVAPGEVWTQTVPAGALSVSLLSPEGVVLDQARLVAVAGERHDVTFDLD